jgi:hypothetical protein
MSAGSADRVCTPTACISLSRLAGSINAQLKGNVAGYVALIGTSKAVSSGLARTAADPPKLAMGPNVMVNVASVGKIFTTIAVLKSLARHHLSIDTRILPFLPPDWVKGILAGTIPVVVTTNSDPGKPISAIVQTALIAATSPRSRRALAAGRAVVNVVVVGVREPVAGFSGAGLRARWGSHPSGWGVRSRSRANPRKRRAAVVR